MSPSGGVEGAAGDAGRETAKGEAVNVMQTETNCTDSYFVINFYL